MQAEIDLKRRAFFQRMAALGENPISLGKKLDQLDQELRDAKKTLRDKQTEIAGVRSRIDTLSRRIENPAAFPIPEQVLNDFLRQEPDAQELYKRISVAKTHYADAVRLIRDPNSQDIRRYLDQVDQAERALDGVSSFQDAGNHTQGPGTNGDRGSIRIDEIARRSGQP